MSRILFPPFETAERNGASDSDDLYKCKSWLPGDTLDRAFQKQQFESLGVPTVLYDKNTSSSSKSKLDKLREKSKTGHTSVIGRDFV